MKRRSSLAVLTALVLALFVAACGDNADEQSGSSGASTAADTNSGLAAAKKNVEAHAQPPAKIGPSEPIGKPIPQGKKLVFINCGAPACALVGASLKEAGSVLGWSVDEIQSAPTPQAVQSAFAEALRRNPDGVVSTGFAKELYQRQLADLNKKKIPVFSGTGTDESSFNPSQGITLEPEPPTQVGEATRLLADKTSSTRAARARSVQCS